MVKRFKKIAGRLKVMHKESGRSSLYLFFDVIRCKRKYEIGMAEYYKHKLDQRDESYKKNFLSRKKEKKMLGIIRLGQYCIVSADKLLSHGLFCDSNIATTELYLYYNPLLKVKNNKKIAFDYIQLQRSFVRKI